MVFLKSIDWKCFGKEYLLLLTIVMVLHGAITPLFRPEDAFTLRANLFAPTVLLFFSIRLGQDKFIFKGCLTAFVFVLVLRLLLNWLFADIERVPLSPLTYWGICFGVALVTALVWRPWKMLQNRSGVGRHDKNQ